MAKTDDTQAYIVISYWPLLDPTKGRFFDPKQMQDFLDDAPEVDIRGCIWALENDKPVPVLIMDKALEVRNHMLEWCEDNPSIWFKFSVLEVEGGKYVLMVYPDIDNSIKRFRLACLHFNSFLPPETATYKVIYNPLRFFCNSSDAYNEIKDKFDSTIKVGFIDIKDIDIKRAAEVDMTIDFDKIVYIENIKRVTEPDPPVIQLMEQLIGNNTKLS